MLLVLLALILAVLLFGAAQVKSFLGVVVVVIAGIVAWLLIPNLGWVVLGTLATTAVGVVVVLWQTSRQDGQWAAERTRVAADIAKYQRELETAQVFGNTEAAQRARTLLDALTEQRRQLADKT